MSSIFSAVKIFFRSKIAVGVAVALVIGVVGYAAFFRDSQTHQFVTVERGPLTQTVSLCGAPAGAGGL